MTTTFIGHFLGPDVHASRPAAAGLPEGTMYVCTTHAKIERVVSAAWVDYATLGSGVTPTTVANDAIWDTKGDLAAATGADTAVKLPVGSNGQVLTADSTQTAGIKWATAGGGGGVTELSYVEFTSSVSISASSEGAADTVVTAAGLTVSGSTKICVEFFAPNVILAGSSTAQVIIVLYQGSSSIGRLAQLLNVAGSSGGPSVFARRFFTPSAGTYTWSVRAWQFGGTGTISAGAGGAGNQFPGYIRITSGG